METLPFMTNCNGYFMGSLCRNTMTLYTDISHDNHKDYIAVSCQKNGKGKTKNII